jgi:hypothetical protein
MMETIREGEMAEVPTLEDQLMADGFATLAFEVQLLVTLAVREADPEKFIRTFVSGMHERIDYNDSKMAQPSPFPHVDEIARQRADVIGENAMQAVRARQNQAPPKRG